MANGAARILIVDDEEHNRQLLEIMLGPEGFVFQAADNGHEALAIVAREPPDLVLLDIMMPDMDGYQVATAIKADHATRHIPIVMITALGDAKVRALAIKSGADDFMTKPVERANLCMRVRQLLPSATGPSSASASGS